MEGPSLFLAAEQLQPFIGKKITRVYGNSKIGIARLENLKIVDIYSWGKHLVFQFSDFAIRVHFLLYGSFEAEVNSKSVTGDYKKPDREPRLAFECSNGKIKMYNCSVKFIEEAESKKLYDYSSDIMSPFWDEKLALEKIKAKPKDTEICDILMDQEIFTGVGNIIKNEVLFLTKTGPLQPIEGLSKKKLAEIAKTAREFSHQFYEWRKVFKLKQNLQIYRKSVCPICGRKVKRAKTGHYQRWSFWCEHDQKLKL